MIFAFWPNERRWVPFKYGHITILVYDDDCWVEVEINRRNLVIRPMFKSEAVDAMLATYAEKTDMVQFEPQDGSHSYFRPLTCVSLAKHYAGIRSRALSPDGVFRDLLRNGGELIHGRRKQTPGI